MSTDSELRMAAVGAALEQISVLMNAEKSKGLNAGGGTIPCPKCQGNLRWGFKRVPRGRGPGRRGTRLEQTIAFACDTPHCLRGSGH